MSPIKAAVQMAKLGFPEDNIQLPNKNVTQVILVPEAFTSTPKKSPAMGSRICAAQISYLTPAEVSAL